jgi:hypothetical protein
VNGRGFQSASTRPSEIIAKNAKIAKIDKIGRGHWVDTPELQTWPRCNQSWQSWQF